MWCRSWDERGRWGGKEGASYHLDTKQVGTIATVGKQLVQIMAGFLKITYGTVLKLRCSGSAWSEVKV
jgi:hypothetical protein